MSRLGRKPLKIVDGVKIEVKNHSIVVEGPKGTLETKLMKNIEIKQDNGILTVNRADDTKTSREAHGLTRVLLENMMIGVSKGYEKKIEIVGVGYRAVQDGNKIKFQLGFSHPYEVEPPEGIEFKVEGTNIISVIGIDKVQVGQVAANLKKVRVPDSYKGKGIRYLGEKIKLKPGKSGKGA